MRMIRGAHRCPRLTVPTHGVFGRPRPRPTPRSLWAAFAIRSGTPSAFDFAYVYDAAHLITDDAAGAVADLAIDWFDRAA